MTRNRKSINQIHMALMTNAIGDTGEMVVSIRLMETGIFMVYLLGGKVPSFDILAEIIPSDNKEMPYQFLVQVKTTIKNPAFTIRDHRLKTPVPKDKLDALIDRPLPSYVAGVDMSTHNVYLVPAFDRNAGYGGSIPDTLCLISNDPGNGAKLTRLKNDVRDFWQCLNIDMYKPNFKSAL